MRWFLTIVALLTSAVSADDLIVVKLSSGQSVAVRMAGGEVTVLGLFDSVSIIGSDPTPPPTSGLHVIVVDDENERGLLPQSQINIFTSTKLTDWLDKNCATALDGEPAYRFSSDDSLVEGEDARKLELPVWVAGWDSVMKAVDDGKIELPAWAVSNGTKGVIEPLPLSVDAAIKRLEEFK